LGDRVEEGVEGSLYRARDTETGAAVLVKLVSPLLSRNPSFGRYFYDKWADRNALVEHPNVLEPLQVGREGELHYVAVADVGGVRLSERIKDAPLPTDETLEILRQVAEGLRAIHRREAVHTNLKPSDVILTTDQMGRMLVKVAFVDLSIAAAESMVSIFGELQGTPKYMAPEVIRGRQPGPESDAFALGVMAYEMVTGREPFPADHAIGYLFANCQAGLDPVEQANADAPHEVALVVARLLARDPEQRYRSMQRVIDDLDRCAQCLRTGHLDSVPFGTDSAFARHYKLPEPPAPTAPGRASLLQSTLVVVVLALVVGVIGFLIGSGHLPAESGEPPSPTRDVAPTLGAPADPSLARPASPAERERAAQMAFNDALARDRESYSARGNYDLGVAAFQAVARDYSDTAIAVRCREETARIYTEWAASLAEAGDHAEAVEKYRLAVGQVPAGSEFAAPARLRLPGALAARADSLLRAQQHEEALALYEQITREHPGSKEARLAADKKPEVLFKRGFFLWRDAGDTEAALGTLTALVADYADSDWSVKARETLPSLYLEAAQDSLEGGRLTEARKQLTELAQAFPEDPAAARAAELDAQVLFRQMTAAQTEENAAQATQHWAELLRRYPDDRWTVEAARVRLAIPPHEGTPYTSVTARTQMQEAGQRRDAFDFRAALGILEGVLRYGQPGTPDTADALALYPRWTYEAAVYDYGRGAPQEAQATLAELSARFPGTLWAQRASHVLSQWEEPSHAGMVYVPEGPFRMGTPRSEVIDLLRQYGPASLLEDVEELWMFAEMCGLLGETPEHLRTVGAFFIDRTEVTNAQYAEYVAATGAAPPSHWQGSTCPPGLEDLPAVNVTLAEAQAYAKWRDCRLPTEAEWEKAARGVDGRRFPWGRVFSETSCNHMRPEQAGLMAAASFPSWVSPYGCIGMIGNAREWTTSPVTAYKDSEWRAGPDAEGMVIARGGAWFQEEIAPLPARCASRYTVDPRRPDPATGFRCVRDDTALPGAGGAAEG